jgi:hypothetical protein
VRTALARFLGDGVREGDELIFATTSGDAWWTARIPEGREDVLALAARVRGRNLADTAPDAISEWEAFRISRFEERNPGGDGGGANAPPANQADQPGQPPTVVPGSMTERVVQRYYQRRICDPLYTPPWQCRAMVQTRAEPVDLRRRNRTQDTLRAVDRAVFALTGERGRKALLFLTEGFLNDPEVTPLQEVAGRCREANLAVYSFDVRGLISGLPGADERNAPNTAELSLMQMEQIDFQAAGSVSLAEETGGFAVRNTNDLAGSAVRVAEESSVYYLFGYAPPEGKGQRDWRKLKIQVKRPGLEVRARKGYTLRTIAEIAAAAERRPARKAAEVPRVPTDVARALASAHDADAIPLRAMAYVLDERPGGTMRTVLAVEADTHGFSNLGGDDRPGTALSLSITATHRDSGKTQRIDQRIKVDSSGGRPWEGWLALSREFDLPPGVAQARIVVRDEFMGRLGAVTVRFEVPPVSGLRVSTPILTTRVSPAKPGAPAQPVLGVGREFAPSGQLYCQFQVFGAGAGAAPHIEATYALRRSTGEVVRQGLPSLIAPGPDGRLVRLLGLPLDGMAEGDYELLLTIEDKATGEKRERVESLRLTARAS